MSTANESDLSSRVQRADYSRLGWALLVSLALHLAGYGTYETGKRLAWWQPDHWPRWLRNSTEKVAQLLHTKKPEQQPEKPKELPLLFVEVNPEQAVVEPPKSAKYYSDKNSVAANPDTSVDTQTPKIDGKQTDIVKTEDVPRAKTFPLQPAVPKQEDKPEERELKPKPAYTPGDLALAKPEDKPQKDPGDAPKKRPGSVAEAKAKLAANNKLSGQRMKQEGGVKRHSNIQSSLDVMNTAFGAYDAAIVAAIQNRWYDLLDSRNFAGEAVGKVTVRFRLNADGSISELSLMDRTVDLPLALLCQTAIKDPAPYAPWPSDMRHQIGESYREVTFTFFYN